MSISDKIRNLLWRILGIDYHHILKIIDYIYLKEDRYSTLGYKSYANNALVFRWGDAPIKIGKYCAIGDGVRFIVDNHKHLLNSVTSYPFVDNEPHDSPGIVIGNDVWIGQNVTILPGVKIGSGVTIGAGSVVTKDIPDYCIVVGVPAKIIKWKCSQEEAKEMLSIAWWDWPENKIKENIKNFKLSIPDFISKFI